MKTLGVFLVGLFVIGASSARAQVKCELFSNDPTCQKRSGPSAQIDFSKGQKLDTPAVPLSSWTPANAVAGRPVKQAFDCQMIRSADRNLDPRIVKAPPSTVKHALRIIEAPACPKK
jgi:hypothetical protein